MPTKPIILTGRDQPDIRGGTRRRVISYGSGNKLVPAAEQNNRRKRVPLLDTDLHKNISSHGRRTLMSLGRHIYFSYEPIRQAVNENAEFATSSFLPEYRGVNKEWKNLAEETLWQHDRWCDLAGPPYCMRSYRVGLIRECMRDGDVGTVYVVRDGQPYLQVIPSHRICSEVREGTVTDGEFDGAQIIDGVIVDDYMKPIAYRVLTGDLADSSQFRDIPAHSMMLHFRPMMPQQVRGISEIGLAAWSMQDLSESRRFELLAQKAGAGRVFQEWNEEGEADTMSDFVTSPTDGSTTSDTPSGLWTEKIDEGINTYFKANSGSRLEAVKFDRPSSNQREFSAGVMREILGSLGTSYDFTIDATKIGGNSSRVLMEKLNRLLRSLQDLVVEPAVRRFDAFRLALFMENGVLPMQEDWNLIEYQGPPRWTGDRKNDADVDSGMLRNGTTSRSRVVSMRTGEALSDVRDARQREADDLFTRAKELANKFDIPFELALSRLEDDGAKSDPNVSNQDEQPEPNPPMTQ